MQTNPIHFDDFLNLLKQRLPYHHKEIAEALKSQRLNPVSSNEVSVLNDFSDSSSPLKRLFDFIVMGTNITESSENKNDLKVCLSLLFRDFNDLISVAEENEKDLILIYEQYFKLQNSNEVLRRSLRESEGLLSNQEGERRFGLDLDHLLALSVFPVSLQDILDEIEKITITDDSDIATIKVQQKALEEIELQGDQLSREQLEILKEAIKKKREAFSEAIATKQSESEQTIQDLLIGIESQDSITPINIEAQQRELEEILGSIQSKIESSELSPEQAARLTISIEEKQTSLRAAINVIETKQTETAAVIQKSLDAIELQAKTIINIDAQQRELEEILGSIQSKIDSSELSPEQAARVTISIATLQQKINRSSAKQIQELESAIKEQKRQREISSYYFSIPTAALLSIAMYRVLKKAH